MSRTDATNLIDDLELFDYRVELDVFSGPLDLLLYLVEKDEIDIFDIPIARITRQYLEYLSVLETIDIELAGEFLVMAARLMEIKSRMLLPRLNGEANEDQTDPRHDLVRQLLEYKAYRQAAGRLQELARRETLVYARAANESPLAQPEAGPESVPIRGVQIWDLVAAFARVLRDSTTAAVASRVVYDETPIQVHMERIERELKRKGHLAFSELFDGPPDRGRLVGIFLALLELVKSRRVRAEQNELFGEIWIFPVERTEATPTTSTLTEG